MPSLAIAHLFSHTSVTRGGAVQGLLLARALQERGHRVTAFFHTSGASHHDAFADAFGHASTRDLDIRQIVMTRTNTGGFRRWLRQEGIDVVHTHKSRALRFAYFAARRLSRPVLIANRGTTYPVKRRKNRRVIGHKLVRHIIAVADAVKYALIDAHNIPAHRISVVYGSFDDERFRLDVQGTHVRDTWQVPPQAPLIACIAAVDRRKGLHVLLRTAQDVVRVYPTATFLLVGNVQDHPYFEELQHQTAELGLCDRVIFTGHRTDVAEILAAADVSVNASTEGEGLTGALRESLAMRKPVVCTAICGNTEIVQDMESGWVVEPNDASALAQAILQALRDPNEATRRAAKGYEWVLQHCTSAVRVEQIEQIYWSVLQEYAS